MEGNDIRMTVALIQAGLIAEGESKIYGVRHMYRGYDDFIEKLTMLGADIKVCEDENAW